MATRQVAHRTTSRLEWHNRELRRREQLGTVWTEHNLLALLQELDGADVLPGFVFAVRERIFDNTD